MRALTGMGSGRSPETSGWPGPGRRELCALGEEKVVVTPAQSRPEPRRPSQPRQAARKTRSSGAARQGRLIRHLLDL